MLFQPGRDNRTTASFLPPLMAGKEDEILLEWQRLTGDPAYKEKDFEDNYAVQRAKFAEDWNLNWHEKHTQHRISRRQEVVVHPERPYFSCTLDGWREFDDCVLDLKDLGGHQKMDVVESYYFPQIVAQMGCTGARNGALLVSIGGAELRELPIKPTPEYTALLWERVDEFWRCVTMLIPPVALVGMVPPPKHFRSIDLDHDDVNWKSEMLEHLNLWRVTKSNFDTHEKTKEAIKKLLPADVGDLNSRQANVLVRRNRAHAVLISKWGAQEDD